MIIGHVTPPGANLFADLGIEPIEAEHLYVRSELMLEIRHIISDRKLKQREAAALFGVSQPRISDLKRGKMDAFTIDSLVDMLAHAGMRVKVEVVDIANEPRTYAKMSASEETDAEHLDPQAQRALKERLPIRHRIGSRWLERQVNRVSTQGSPGFSLPCPPSSARPRSPRWGRGCP